MTLKKSILVKVAADELPTPKLAAIVESLLTNFAADQLLTLVFWMMKLLVDVLETIFNGAAGLVVPIPTLPPEKTAAKLVPDPPLTLTTRPVLLPVHDPVLSTSIPILLPAEPVLVTLCSTPMYEAVFAAVSFVCSKEVGAVVPIPTCPRLIVKYKLL